jgi:endonuclease/exonuclease/phosphatase (EEP) superfamily protein YafD
LLLGAAVLGLLRQSRFAALVLVFAGVNLAATAPQLVAWQRAEASAGTELRFVLANVNAMNQNHQPLLSFIEEADPDVIVLQEVNQRWVDGVASLGSEYPYSVVEPQEGYFGIGLWSRVPIVSGEARYFLKERIPAIVATLDTPGGEIPVVSTHAMPPRSAFHVDLRDRQLEAMSELARSASSDVVVLADLNATPWSHVFRSFVRSSGLKDASRGHGLQWTWPALIWPLVLPIDHALVSEEVRVLDVWTGPPIGSDHHPLVLDAGF